MRKQQSKMGSRREKRKWVSKYQQLQLQGNSWNIAPFHASKWDGDRICPMVSWKTWMSVCQCMSDRFPCGLSSWLLLTLTCLPETVWWLILQGLWAPGLEVSEQLSLHPSHSSLETKQIYTVHLKFSCSLKYCYASEVQTLNTFA